MEKIPFWVLESYLRMFNWHYIKVHLHMTQALMCLITSCLALEYLTLAQGSRNGRGVQKMPR